MNLRSPYVFVARPRPFSQQVSRRNAQRAMIVLAQRRRERDEVEDFLATWEPKRRQG